MTNPLHQNVIAEFLDFINQREFPCVGAKTAVAKLHLHCMVADHMACPKDDGQILGFIYKFIDDFRSSEENFHSVAIIFTAPEMISEEMYDELFWNRLQALSDLDAKKYDYDPRVESDPASSFFSYSLKEEAFFIIGMHPASNRPSRQFKYPVIVFNPHVQFEKLRATHKYEHLKETIRKRDMEYSGSINSMLDDFGNSSEAFQYSGRQYDKSWTCPLKINHAINKHH